MSVRIGHASINESGRTIGGLAGDQNAKEVCIREFYSKPWTHLLRCKNPVIANKMAEICEQGCNNPNIGYDQKTRNSAYQFAKMVGYNLSKITIPCNVDCSSFMTLVAICAGVKQLEYTSNAPTTSTMVNTFLKTGLFDVCAQPNLLVTDQYLMKGDILVKPGSHTVMVLDDGPATRILKGQVAQTTVPVTVTKTTSQPVSYPNYMRKGIDISGYNEVTDYSKIKADGVQFAILKIIRKDLLEDKLFMKHLAGCRSVGIPIQGVYNYSYATTPEKARTDALRVIQILQKYNLKCTVYLDVEDNCQKNLGINLINIINTYQSTIESAGYTFGLYTGLSFYNSFLKPFKKFLNVTNEWIARYPSDKEMPYSAMPSMDKKPNIGTAIEGWQYTSKAKVNGIKGVVDVNLMFDLIDSSITTKLGIVANCNKLNFRSAPSTDSSVLSILIRGEKLIILDTLDGWYKVQYNDIVGYCSAQYITKL